MGKLIAHKDIVKLADKNGGYDNIRKYVEKLFDSYDMEKYEFRIDMMILSYITQRS